MSRLPNRLPFLRFAARFRPLVSIRPLAWGGLALGAALTMAPAAAHHPEHQTRPVTPRVEVIGPIGSRLPASYRRRYNRPRYWAGKIAYHIAPSSQEAMAWHRAAHRGAYDKGNRHLRYEQHSFYPKPWQALPIGPRRPQSEEMTAAPARVETLETEMLETPRADVPQLPPHASGRELPDIRVESLPDLEAGGTVQEAPQFEAPQR